MSFSNRWMMFVPLFSGQQAGAMPVTKPSPGETQGSNLCCRERDPRLPAFCCLRLDISGNAKLHPSSPSQECMGLLGVREVLASSATCQQLTCFGKKAPQVLPNPGVSTYPALIIIMFQSISNISVYFLEVGITSKVYIPHVSAPSASVPIPHGHSRWTGDWYSHSLCLK